MVTIYENTLNAGQASFSKLVLFQKEGGFTWRFRSASIVDANGDGLTDIVYSGDVQSILYSPQLEPKVFPSPETVTSLTVADLSRQHAFADINGDGLLDIVAGPSSGVDRLLYVLAEETSTDSPTKSPTTTNGNNPASPTNSPTTSDFLEAKEVNDFCADLSNVESFLKSGFEAFRGLSLTTSYVCKCNFPSEETFELDCQMDYTGSDQQPYTNREQAIYKLNGHTGLYELTSTGWGDSEYGTSLQETFEFTGANRQLSKCTGNNCVSCAICSDGTSIHMDCSSLGNDLAYTTVCSDEYKGSFFNSFQDGGIKKQEDDPTSTSSSYTSCNAWPFVAFGVPVAMWMVLAVAL